MLWDRSSEQVSLLILSQVPRPLSQSDLEEVLATTRKTGVAANEYGRLSSQLSTWSRREPDDYQVQAALNELSKLVVSQIVNLQPDSQDS